MLLPTQKYLLRFFSRVQLIKQCSANCHLFLKDQLSYRFSAKLNLKFFALTFFFHSSIQSNEIKNSESVVDKLASIPAKSHFVNLAYYGSYVFVKLLSDVILETFLRENNLIKVCHHVDFYILEYYIFPIFKNLFFLFQWNSYFSYGEFDYVLW